MSSSAKIILKYPSLNFRRTYRPSLQMPDRYDRCHVCEEHIRLESRSSLIRRLPATHQESLTHLSYTSYRSTWVGHSSANHTPSHGVVYIHGAKRKRSENVFPLISYRREKQRRRRSSSFLPSLHLSFTHP